MNHVHWSTQFTKCHLQFLPTGPPSEWCITCIYSTWFKKLLPHLREGGITTVCDDVYDHERQGRGFCNTQVLVSSRNNIHGYVLSGVECLMSAIRVQGLAGGYEWGPLLKKKVSRISIRLLPLVSHNHIFSEFPYPPFYYPQAARDLDLGRYQCWVGTSVFSFHFSLVV
jgi:hypothetical protein